MIRELLNGLPNSIIAVVIIFIINISVYRDSYCISILLICNKILVLIY